MKSTLVLAGVTAFAAQVAAHATFQDLWINGKDQICSSPHVSSSIANVELPVFMR